jgi:hypothetical protein
LNVTPTQHFDNLASACLAKAAALQEAADKYPNHAEEFREQAQKERKAAIEYIEMAKGFTAHA